MERTQEHDADLKIWLKRKVIYIFIYIFKLYMDLSLHTLASWVVTSGKDGC